MRKVVPIIIITLALVSIHLILNLQQENSKNHADDAITPVEETIEEIESKNDTQELYIVDRSTAIPNDVTKIFPEQDHYPPQLHSSLYEDPVLMPGPINTAGAEDSPFILPCGCEFYFVFVPDVRVPPDKQLIDGASGIYITKKVDGVWSEPERVILNADVSLDGCHFVQGDVMWFCSVRLGNYREVDLYTARYVDGEWVDWTNVGEQLNVVFQVGEMHLSRDGTELYFHSNREGGMGGTDIWITRMFDGVWQEPENIEAVNTVENEGMPFLNQAGDELWFTRPYLGSPAVYVSKKVEGVWREPELIISQFAGEPSLDEAGNIYFVHHYYDDGEMLEADIYVAYRKPSIKPADVISEPSRGYLLGTLPIPYKGLSFAEAYKKVSETCELVPVWGKPSPFWEKASDLKGSWGNTFVEELTRGNDMAPLLHFSFMGEGLTLSSPYGIAGSLNNQEWRRQYKRAVVESVEVTKPIYLSIGNEVNRWYEKYGWEGENGFKHWLSLYEDIYDEVKELSPETKIFCTFSREIVSENREADMSVIDFFDSNKLDVLVLTSYPYSVAGINRPNDIPADYYTKIFDRLPGKPVGFSEIMWPSMPQFGGEQAQADFIVQIGGELVNGLDVEFIIWPWLSDLTDADYTGLLNHDGTNKLGYNAWRSLSEG